MEVKNLEFARLTQEVIEKHINPFLDISEKFVWPLMPGKIFAKAKVI